MTDETANDFIDSEANNDGEPTGEDPDGTIGVAHRFPGPSRHSICYHSDGTIDVAHPTAETHNVEIDEAAGENSAEDN